MENNYLLKLKHWKDQISILKKNSLKLGIFLQIRHFSKNFFGLETFDYQFPKLAFISKGCIFYIINKWVCFDHLFCMLYNTNTKSITKPIIYYKWPLCSVTNEKTKYELPNQLEYQLTISIVITSY